MTNRKLFNRVLLERECIRNRIDCNKICRGCPYGSDLMHQFDTMNDILDILKSRDPELYFADNITLLKEILGDEYQG